MSRSSYTSLIGALLLSAIIAVLSGCGYKTDPVPPQSVVPLPINDLRFSLDENGATLTWSYPIKTLDGQDIAEITSFELFRAELPLDDFCAGCPIPYTGPLEIPGGVTSKEARQRARHVSGLLRSGNKYFFKVRSRTSWWATSGDSNIVSFVYYTPSAAPQNLRGSGTNGRISLQWSAVSTLIDGKTADLPVSYRVLKSGDGKSFQVVADALKNTSFIDRDVEIGDTYFYRVQSDLIFDSEVIEGRSTAAVQVEVVDTFPPEMVSGVRVVATDKSIRVFWSRVEADDLAGYKIYRRSAKEADFTLVGEVEARQTIFIDENYPQDTKLYYAISAVDEDGNEGQRSEEVTSRH